MKYRIEQWTIQQLWEAYQNKVLNLSPSYQRNDIWTIKAQQDLINSITNEMPIPNFFLHERDGSVFDVADGQQRTRAIIAYIKGEIATEVGRKYNNEEDFKNYLIPIVVINNSVSEEEIRNFYVKVNNTGLRLNNPELTKSEFFNSKVLALVEELSDLAEVKALGLFSEKQEDRMIDREFMEELVAQIIYGITEKKLAIRKLYTEHKDITDEKINEIKKEFIDIIEIITNINDSIGLRFTRYSQKNDFYTLFGLLRDHKAKQQTFNEIFNFLVKIQDDISPSNDKCQLLQEYAFNCITQSHGKPARERRYKIFKSIAFNDAEKISKEQKTANLLL